MEELTGGELFDRIVQKEFYSESEAAKVWYEPRQKNYNRHSFTVVAGGPGDL